MPEPGPGQVLVRARAVSLNNADVHQLDSSAALAAGQQTEYLAGYEFAGDIVATGPGADSVHVGGRVMGTTQGAFAQYVLADHRADRPHGKYVVTHVLGLEGIPVWRASAVRGEQPA